MKPRDNLNCCRPNWRQDSTKKAFDVDIYTCRHIQQMYSVDDKLLHSRIMPSCKQKYFHFVDLEDTSLFTHCVNNTEIISDHVGNME